MPRYLIERLFDQREPTPNDSQVAKRLRAEDFTDLVWEHSHVGSADENGAIRTFCLYSGPSEARIREHSSLTTRSWLCGYSRGTSTSSRDQR